jgi:histidinol-phosphate phosphatase family protein
MKNKAVFLDRDGTIAYDVPYCSKPEDFKLMPTVPEAIRLLNSKKYKVIVITNQSGIARGYFTVETLAQIHNKMRNDLEKQGAFIDAVYYCPHHPDDKCDCRKPNTGLFLKAIKEHEVETLSSSIIGDMQLDIDSGKKLGCKTVLVTPDNPNVQNDSPPDYCAKNLLDAAQWIIRNT